MIIILVLAIALVAGILYLRHQVTVRFATSNVDAVSAEATLGSISTQVSGTGTLMNVNEESLVVPVGVIVEEILVSAHDSVAEGQLLAKTDTASVLTAMSSKEEELDSIDSDITSAANDTVNSYISSGVAGRVKQVFAESGEDIAACMYDHGALAILSLDGYMSVDVEAEELSTGDSVTVLMEDGTQMSGLVEELLSLSRADNQRVINNRQKMDFSKCISDAILPFEPIFYEKGLIITTEIEENIRVKGNEAQMKQVPAILLDNAQKYCTPATETIVRLQRRGRNALLTVDSHGAEMTPAELTNIFRRFYRLDKARNMNHSYGLGLATAKQIVENHRGRIWAKSHDGINRFCVQLPCEQN